MKRVIQVAGISLVAAAAAAVLLGTFRLTLAVQERSVHLVPGRRPVQVGRASRRRCVRLGWKAPYWYAGASRNEISTPPLRRDGR